MKQFINDSWSGIMIRDNTPLKHIPNTGMDVVHYIQRSTW